ncbi:MAG: DNRLRE domain-containing protein [Phycisphaerae bacterium]
MKNVRSTAILGPFIATILTGVSVSGASPVSLSPAADNTLYTTPNGKLSNGAGQHLFVGNNSGVNTRRAVIRFDLEGIVPAGSIVESVSLMMYVSQANAGVTPVALHRVAASWGEGASDGFGPEGAGAASEAGDATWIHRFYPDQLWNSPGGDFDAQPSAITSVDAPGFYVWVADSSDGPAGKALTDVQSWVDDPTSNHGWILRGTEEGASTAKRLNSKEHPDDQLHPVLTIEFTDARQVPTISTWGLAILALLLMTAAKLYAHAGKRRASSV